MLDCPTDTLASRCAQVIRFWKGLDRQLTKVNKIQILLGELHGAWQDRINAHTHVIRAGPDYKIGLCALLIDDQL
jgi:hypothetical protein